jgi:archaellum component FlaF (FlaF/FlaG flagellin family)
MITTWARGNRALALAVISLLALVFAATPAQAATAVKISRIYYNSPGTDTRTNTSLNAEYVNVQNISSVTQVVTGWTVRDAANHVYTFPATSIPPGGTVTVHTGKGTNSGNQRYWGSGAYIWNNDMDTGYLRNSSGAAIFTCSYNSTAASYKNC